MHPGPWVEQGHRVVCLTYAVGPHGGRVAQPPVAFRNPCRVKCGSRGWAFQIPSRFRREKRCGAQGAPSPRRIPRMVLLTVDRSAVLIVSRPGGEPSREKGGNAGRPTSVP